jgi:phosphatidate cytidylyltransferase
MAGKRPFQSASPKKTWEGTLLGVIASIAAAEVLGLWNISAFSENLWHFLLVGLLAGILAPLGDLTESIIKRDLGVKDMGTLLPGHGGVLDRVDGLLFVLPGIYYLALLLL